MTQDCEEKIRELKRARLGSVNMMMNEQIDGPASTINLNADKSLGTNVTAVDIGRIGSLVLEVRDYKPAKPSQDSGP